jgi:FkbM family methyltransferase
MPMTGLPFASVNALVRLRRQLPRSLRARVLSAAGRTPDEPMLEVELPLPARSSSMGDPDRRLRLRLPRRVNVAVHIAARGFGGYEPDSLACFLAAIECQGHRPVYDVGANIGVYAWLASALTDAEVVAFEPTPDLAAHLRAVCLENALATTVEELALGARAETATLYLSARGDSSNSLRAGFRPATGAIEVEVVQIDGYVDRTGRPPAVLKVDTESTEPDVLRGASRLLADHRPWIVCEVLAGRTESELMAILGPLGYRYHLIDGSTPLRRRDMIVGDPVALNWLFTPVDPPPTFWDSVAVWRSALAALPPPVRLTPAAVSRR